MRPLIIVNPHAAGGRAGRTLREVRGVLERRLGPVDVVLTGGAGTRASSRVHAAREGRPLVVALGGDGTLHEVVNGVLDGGGTSAVGLVGSGDGRRLPAHARTRAPPRRYVDALASGRERKVDVGRATWTSADGGSESRWFVNILSAGMGGLVDRHVAETTKVFGGKAAYLLGERSRARRDPRGGNCVAT